MRAQAREGAKVVLYRATAAALFSHTRPPMAALMGRGKRILGQTSTLTFSCTWLGANSDRGATAIQSARAEGDRWAGGGWQSGGSGGWRIVPAG